MEGFINEAAANITSKLSLVDDPLTLFRLRHFMYYVILWALIVNWIWSIHTLRSLDKPFQRLLSIDSDILNTLLRISVYVLASVDFWVLSVAIFTGFVSNWLLKLDWYSTHQKWLLSCLFSNFTVFYLDPTCLTIILFRTLCYVYLKFMISQIYSGIMHRIFLSIPNKITRLQVLAEFNKLIEVDYNTAITPNRYGGAYYRYRSY